MGLEKMWQKVRINEPRRWPIWSLLEERFAGGGRFLDVGPGCWPKIPIKGSYFIDVSPAAAKKLSEAGGRAVVGRVEDLPCQSEGFDLVCAFEILEHIKEHERAFAEIYRVLKGKGIFALDVPLFEKYWSFLDDWAGHIRRYHPKELEALLEQAGFGVERFCCPRNLFTFITEQRPFRLIGLAARFLALAEKYAPSAILTKLYDLYSLSPLNRMRGLDQTSWEKGRLADIRDRSFVVIFCRKLA